MWNCQSGCDGSSGVAASSATKRSSSVLSAAPGRRMRLMCRAISNCGSSHHQVPVCRVSVRWRKRGKANSRSASAASSRDTSTGPARTRTPTMTMRLVGRSMRSQVVSTGAMRSLFDIGQCPAAEPSMQYYCLSHGHKRNKMPEKEKIAARDHEAVGPGSKTAIVRPCGSEDGSSSPEACASGSRERLARTHADLLANPRFEEAAKLLSHRCLQRG